MVSLAMVLASVMELSMAQPMAGLKAAMMVVSLGWYMAVYSDLYEVGQTVVTMDDDSAG
jgi:hypothetical protein